jgi:hypothetical protein
VYLRKLKNRKKKNEKGRDFVRINFHSCAGNAYPDEQLNFLDEQLNFLDEQLNFLDEQLNFPDEQIYF